MKSAIIQEMKELRDRVGVFRDRAHAGEVLASLLEPHRDARPLVLAIPAGGVPVAAVVADRLGCPLDVAVVSKITLPWNTEAGFGAVAFDGTVRLNEKLLPSLGLSGEEVRQGIERTREKVARRVARFRGERPFPELAGRHLVLVDDGLASGFTMLTALAALEQAGAEHVTVAVPTGHAAAVKQAAEAADVVCCPNIRGGWSFAVASAYELWTDVTEEEAARILNRFIPEAGAG